MQVGRKTRGLLIRVRYCRMSDTDASDCDKLKKALLARYIFTEDGYRKRFREVKPETEETPHQFVVHLNYLAKWLELSGSIPGDFNAIVDLIVKEQFINACSEELAVYLPRERTQGPGRVNYMGSAVPDRILTAVRGQDQFYSPA